MEVRAESISIGPHASWAWKQSRGAPLVYSPWDAAQNAVLNNLNTAATYDVRRRNKKNYIRHGGAVWVKECFRLLRGVMCVLGKCISLFVKRQ
jgi:hypothetical protein